MFVDRGQLSGRTPKPAAQRKIDNFPSMLTRQAPRVASWLPLGALSDRSAPQPPTIPTSTHPAVRAPFSTNLQYLEKKGEPAGARLAVRVSLASHGRCKSQSLPRKACPELAEGRESIPQAFRNALSRDWIPAFAGMTGASKGIPSQMTAARAWEKPPLFLIGLLTTADKENVEVVGGGWGQ